MNISMRYGCFVGVFTSFVVMCKILAVVVAFFLWALTNSTFLGRDSLPLVLILNTFHKLYTHVSSSEA